MNTIPSYHLESGYYFSLTSIQWKLVTGTSLILNFNIVNLSVVVFSEPLA